MTEPKQPGEPLSPLKLAFLKLQEAEARIRQLEAGRTEPIAIIGIGCRIPGAEEGPESFWHLVRENRCAISDGMEQRIRATSRPVQFPEAARSAALLKQVDLFDPQHFGISPREATAMDPQQRLLLEVSWEALEHAGVDPGSLYQTNTGVFVGIASHDYAQLQMRWGNLHFLHPHFASGTALSVAAGRISYTLGLNGPAISVDTACSSSLVAVHLACESLNRKECSSALAGGVNLILAPEASIAFAHSGMLSSRGVSSPFLDSADGFVRGEGCGMVVLKRLSDAQADGDRIMAVIVGSAVNQDGASSGLTAPNGLSQQALLREAYRRAGVEPSDVGYVETHGTGTKLGDPIEAEALGTVFAGRPDKIAIGSVKANVGHLESAAGVAGLIKLVLSLEHKQIPGQIQNASPSEHIRWQQIPLEMPATTSAWQPIAGRRIGGVSSFGFSGTNAHVVVEEAPGEKRESHDPEHDDVLTLSARTESALRQMVEKYASYLTETNWNWSDICHTAGVGRAALPERLAVVAGSRIAAAGKLRDWLNGNGTNGVYRGQVKVARRGAPGQSARLTPEAVAELFVNGGIVDWQRRAKGRELRRAVLPTYPFQRERYWFEERDPSRDLAAEASTNLPGPVEPARQLPELQMLIATASAEQRLEIIRKHLRNEVAKVLGMGRPAEIDEDKSLAELGMDSLMALELKHSVQQSSGVNLPANFMFEYPTIGRAATYLNAMIGTAPSEARSPNGSAEYEDIAL